MAEYEAEFELKQNNLKFNGELRKNQMKADLIIKFTPDKTSQLINDSGFIAMSALIPLQDDILDLQNGKVDKEVGKGLSTNDFTNAYKSKLEGIEAGAEVNKVNSVNGQIGVVTINIPTKTSDLTNDSNFATVSQIPTNNNQLTNGAGYITGITSTAVTNALGYTPYNSTNPNGYITSSALDGYATEQYVDDIVGDIETILASI